MDSYIACNDNRLIRERTMAVARQSNYCVGAIAWKGRHTKCTCIQSLHRCIPPVIEGELVSLILLNWLLIVYQFILDNVVSTDPVAFRNQLLKHVNTSRANGARSTAKLSFKCDFTIEMVPNSPPLKHTSDFLFFDNLTICTHSLSYILNFSKEEYDFYFDKKLLRDHCFKAFMVKLYLLSTFSKVTEMNKYENVRSTRVNWKFVLDRLAQDGIKVNHKTIRQYYNNNSKHFSGVVTIPFSIKSDVIGFHKYFSLSSTQTQWVIKYAPSIGTKRAWSSVSMYNYIQYTNPSSSYGSLSGFLGYVCNCSKIKRDDSESFRMAESIDKVIEDNVGIGKITIHMGFMHTKHNSYPKLNHPQDPHVDFSWRDIDKNKGRVFFGIISLNTDGSFLEVWNPPPDSSEGGWNAHLIHVPFGQTLILPAEMVHAGGFCSDPFSGNLRIHLYLYSNSVAGNFDKQNNYCDRYGVEMCTYMKHHELIDCDGIFNTLV